jgi:hypothetical protein
MPAIVVATAAGIAETDGGVPVATGLPSGSPAAWKGAAETVDRPAVKVIAPMRRATAATVVARLL